MLRCRAEAQRHAAMQWSPAVAAGRIPISIQQSKAGPYGHKSGPELTADVDLFRNWESSIGPNPEYVVCCGLQSEAFVVMQ